MSKKTFKYKEKFSGSDYLRLKILRDLINEKRSLQLEKLIEKKKLKEIR